MLALFYSETFTLLAQQAQRSGGAYQAGRIAGQVTMVILIIAVIWKVAKKFF